MVFKKLKKDNSEEFSVFKICVSVFVYVPIVVTVFKFWIDLFF